MALLIIELQESRTTSQKFSLYINQTSTNKYVDVVTTWW